MKLAVNAIPLLMPLTGIGQYTSNLVRELGRYEDIEKRLFFAVRWGADVVDRPSQQTIGLLRSAARIVLMRSHTVRRWIQQRRFSEGLARNKVDLYHEPNYVPFRHDGPTVITIHDLSYVRYPETFPGHRLRFLEKHMPEAVERASHILADSEFVRQEIVGYFGVSPQKVHTTLLGVRDTFRPRQEAETRATLSSYGLEHERFVLSVGTLEPRKNLISALRAYDRLPIELKDRYPLVLVGMKGWHTEAIEREIAPMVARGRVRVLDYVSEQALPDLYSGAAMLLYPSMYEGFGLPPLEAMASGIPVVTSNRSSLPEVVGNVGLRVDPQDIAGITESMRSLLEDRTEAHTRGKLGVERAASFTWQRCAQRTVEVYRMVHRH